MNPNRHLLVAAALAAATHAWAQSEVVVSASRLTSDPARVSADVSVITSEQMQAIGAVTVAEALQRLAGVQIATNGGWGKKASAFVRGGNSGHVVVFIDGVRVGSETTGAFDWAMLSADEVERIEIVRGPQSGLYGSDAITGAIHIYTKRGADKPRLHALAEAGGLGSAHAAASIAAANGEVRYRLGVNARRSRDVSAYAKGTEPDPMQALGVSFALDAPLGPGMLSLTARQDAGRTALDNMGADALSFTQLSWQQALALGYALPLGETWELRVKAGRSVDALHGRDLQSSWNNYDIRTTQDTLRLVARYAGEALAASLGVDWRSALGINDASKIHHRRIQTGAFAEAGWLTERWGLDGAVRQDWNSFTKNAFTWRAGGYLRPMPALTLSANYGTAFKAPTLNDLFWPATAWSSGNPNLRPEKAQGWDAGVDWTALADEAGKLALGARYFDETVRDLIQWGPIPGNPFFWKPQNVARARLRGWEFSAQARWDAFWAEARWTLLDAKDEKTGKRLARRARESGSFALGADLGRAGASLDIVIQGPRFDDAKNTKPLAGYHLINLRGWLAVGEGMKLVARVENAENKHYELAKGYGVRPRVVWLGVEASK